MDDSEFHAECHRMGRIPPIFPRMYLGNIVEIELPRRADAAIFEVYARLPSWHVEEAASLVAGFAPRKNLQFFPTAGLPGNPDVPRDTALTWNALLQGDVGTILGLYARHKQMPGFGPDSLYVRPDEFLRFCTEYGLPVPAALTECFQGAEAARESADPVPRPVGKKEQRYRRITMAVARDLREDSAQVTVQQLKDLVEHEFSKGQRAVSHRGFRQYLEAWRRAEPDGELLAGILRSEQGRPSDEDEKALQDRLREKFKRVLWPAARAARKTRQIK